MCANPDVGKLRGLQHIVSEDGFFFVCALDHFSDIVTLAGPDQSVPELEQVVRTKTDLLEAFAASISAVLLDPPCMGYLVDAAIVPRNVGVLANIDDGYAEMRDGLRRGRLREGWSTRKMKLAGVDMCKFLWWFRPDRDSRTGGYQRELLTSLVRECAELSLPLLAEPMWYPLPDEDPASSEWQDRRVRGIIDSAAEAEQIGVDVLKVEFPGYVDSPESQARAAAACEELDRSVHVPWALLSAGVGYEDFRTQVQIACAAGASGYIAGRSVWQDAVSSHGTPARYAMIDRARACVDELNDITREYGRPFHPNVAIDKAIADLPEDWFKGWHDAT